MTGDARHKSVQAILTVAKGLKELGNREEMPKDIHNANVMIREDGLGSAAVVDIGNRYQRLDQGLLRLIGFYGYFGEDVDSNDFIFKSFIDIFGQAMGMSYLRANLVHLRKSLIFDEKTGREEDQRSVSKDNWREEVEEPSLRKSDVQKIISDLESFISHNVIQKEGRVAHESVPTHPAVKRMRIGLASEAEENVFYQGASSVIVAREKAEFGFLEDDNPIVQYIREIANHLAIVPSQNSFWKTSPKIYVLREQKEVDAFALPDGSIILSLPMLELLKSEDELASLLAHEMMHIRRGHSRQLVDHLLKNQEEKGIVGLMRLSEVEADLLPVTGQLSEAGYHPLAGVPLMEHLRAHFKSEAWSVEHGGLLDRKFNILSFRQLMDLDGIDQELKEFSPGWENELRGAIAAIPKERTFKHLTTLAQYKTVDAFKRSLTELSSIELSRIMAVLKKVLPDTYKKLYESNTFPDRHGKKLSAFPKTFRLAVGDAEADIFLNGLVSLWGQRIDRNVIAEGLTSQETKAVLGVLAAVGLKMPILDTGHQVDVSLDSTWEAQESFYLFDAIWHQLKEANSLDIFLQALDIHRLRAAGIEGNLMNFNDLWRQMITLMDDKKTNLQLYYNEETGEFDLDGFWRFSEAFYKKAKQVYMEAGMDVPSEHEFLAMRIEALADEVSAPQLKELIQAKGMADPFMWMALAKSYGIEVAKGLFQESLSREEMQKLRNQIIMHLMSSIYSKRKDISASENLNELLSAANEKGQENQELSSAIDEIFSNVGLEILDKFLRNARLPPGPFSTKLLEYYIDAGATLEQVNWTFSRMDTDKHDRRKVDGESIVLNEFHVLKRLHNRLGRYGFRGLDYLEESTFYTRLIDLSNEKVSGGDFEGAWQLLRDLLEDYEPDFYLNGPSANYFPNLRLLRAALMKNAKDDPDKLLMVSELFFDPVQKERVRAHAIRGWLDRGDFSTLLREFLDSPLKYRQKAAIHPAFIHWMVEEKAQTEEELETLQNRIFVLYDRFGRYSVESFVAQDAVLKEGLKESAEFLISASSTRPKDQRLQKFMFTQWWKTRLQDSRGTIEREYLLNETRAGYFDEIIGWINEPWKDFFYEELEGLDNTDGDNFMNEQRKGHQASISVPDLMQKLYEMDRFQKIIFLRKLLTDSKNGIVFRKADMEHLARHLIQDVLGMAGPEGVEAEKIALAFIEVIPPEEAYFLLTSFLEDIILKAPTESSDSWEFVPEIVRATEGLSRERFRDKATERFEDLDFTVRNFADAVAVKAWKWAFDKSDQEWAVLLREEKELLDSLGIAANDVSQEAITPMRALLGLIRGQGSVGVRGGQVFGQYYPLSSEMENHFSGLFDDNEGQSKMAAYHLIKREVPGYLKPGDRIVKRIGGGSLYTVYLIIKADGTQRVLRVLNPNAVERVKVTLRIAYRVMDLLISQDPENNNYQFIRNFLLKDLEAWLLGDINDTHFPENDKKFKTFTETYNAQRGGRFQMYVPRTYQPNTRFLKEEEFIEGKNLTEIRIGDHDDYEQGVLTEASWRELMDKVGEFYWAQIKDETGLVHSDIHPGNLRLMKDGRVGVLDRNFYIELDSTDRDFIQKFTRNVDWKEKLKSLGNAEKVLEGRLNLLLDYLAQMPDNQNQPWVQQKAAMAERFAHQYADSPGGVQEFERPESWSELVLSLKQEGVVFPLKWTLLMKNFNSLYRMGKRIPRSADPTNINSPSIDNSPSNPGGDAAMNSKKSPEGGIDLKSDKVDSAFVIKNSGEGIKFHIDPDMLQKLQNTPGFMPVIINIEPMNNLPQFLGLSQQAETTQMAGL